MMQSIPTDIYISMSSICIITQDAKITSYQIDQQYQATATSLEGKATFYRIFPDPSATYFVLVGADKRLRLLDRKWRILEEIQLKAVATSVEWADNSIIVGALDGSISIYMTDKKLPTTELFRIQKAPEGKWGKVTSSAHGNKTLAD